MATAIDERIVAAKFDASDFEKGVNKTIKKLDELKKELNLKDAAKSVKELGEKTEESTKSMSNSLEKLTDRFTNFTGMLKQKLLSGIADEIVGVFFKMTNAIKSFTKSISTDQIGAGLGKYQEILTSVRVMMSAGVPEGTAYEEIEKINNYVKETSYSLTQMTDALSKMTSAGVEVSKATKSVQGIANACADAGVNATDAQRAFYNLSQAYSKGALNYTDYKSLELLNMTTRKFKENLLEAAATEGTLKKIKDDINGVATYQITKKAKGKGGSGKKVNINNLADMMRYDFITNDVMDRIFGGTYYFSDNELLKILQKDLGLDVKSIYDSKITDADREKAQEIAKKRFGEIAVAAYNAAKEARSFTDVMNTFKDYVATGWAKSFELIFGKLETAKEFFTELTQGELAEAIYYISDWRNEVLSVWNESANGKGSGGEAFRQGILNITDAIGGLISMFTDLLPKEDDAAASLYEMTLGFRDTTANIKEAIEGVREWLNSPMFGEKSKTRLDSIKITLSNIGSVLSIVGKVISTVFTSIKTIATAISPIFDGLLIFFENLTSPLSELEKNDKPFDQITHSVNDLITVLKPVAEYLGKILGFLGKVGAFFLQLSIDTFTESISFFADILGLIIKLITGHSEELEKGEGTLTQMAKDFEDIKNACSSGLNAVKEFFSAIITDLKKLFGLTDEAENKTEEGGVFSSLKKFFETNEFVQSAKAWVDQAIIDVSNFIKDLPNKVMKFGKNIYDTLWGLFFEEKQVDVIDEKTGRKTGKKESVAILTPLGQWVNTIILKVKNWFAELPQKIISGVGKVTNWINEVFNYWFAPRDEGRTVFESKDGKWVEKSVLEVSRFDDFIFEVSLAVREWFNDLPNKISKAFSSMGDFLSKIIKIIDEFLFGKKVTHKRKIDIDANGKPIFKMVTERYKTGFSKWLDGVIQEIKKFIKKIPEYIKKGIKGAGDLISTVISALFGTGENDKDGKQAQKKVQDAVEKPFLGIDITSALEAIKGVGLELFNQVMRIFTGSEDLEANEKAFADAIASGIEWIRKKAKEALDWVLEFLSKLPSKIAGIFSDENKEAGNPEESTVGKEILAFAEMIGNFLIFDLPTTILKFVDDAIVTIDGLLSKLWESVEESTEGQNSEAVVDKINEAAENKTVTEGELSPWQKLIEQLGKTISRIFSTLPVWIIQGINAAVEEISKLVNDIPAFLDRIFGESVDESEVGIKQRSKDISDVVGDAVKDATDKATESANKNAEETSGLLTAVVKIGESLKTLFVETIPGFITSAWNTIFAFGSEVWTGLSALFTGQDQPTSPVAGAVYAFGNSIYNWITKVLPLKVREAIFWVKHELFKVKIDPPTTDDLFDEKKMLKQRNSKVAGDLKDEIKDDVNKAKEEANTELSNDDGSMWTFVSGIGEALKKGFADLGPAILTGLAEALAFIGNIFTFIINFLTGKTSIADQIEEAYGKKQPELVEALKSIGENIKNFFLTIIPEFIGSTIGTLAGYAGEWLTKLFGAFSKASKNAEQQAVADANAEGEETEDPVKAASSLLNVILDFFNNEIFKAGIDAVKTIAVLFALVSIFKALKDLLSVTDELDAASRTLKWATILIAVSALAGVVSHITSVVDDVDHPEKYRHVREILDKLSEFLYQIMGIMAIFYGGKILSEAVEIDGKAKNAKTVTNALSNGQQFMSSLSTGLTSFLSSFGITAGIGLGSTVLGAGMEDLVDSISDSFMVITSGMSDALDVIFPFIDKLAEIKDKIDDAKLSVKGIKDIFTSFYGLFNDVYAELFGSNVQKLDSVVEDRMKLDKVGREEEYLSSDLLANKDNINVYLDYLDSNISFFSATATALNELATSLDKIDKIPDINAAFEKLGSLFKRPERTIKNSRFTDFLIDLFDSIAKAMEKTKLNKSSTTGSPLRAEMFNQTVASYTLLLDMVAKALSTLSVSFAGLTFSDSAAFNIAVSAIGDLINILKDTSFTQGNLDKKINNKTLSAIGYQIEQFGLHMKKFIGHITSFAGFDSEEMKTKTLSQINAAITIAKEFAEAFNDANLSESVKINEYSENLPKLGESIAQFLSKFNEAFKSNEVDITNDRIIAISDIVKSVSILFAVLTNYASNRSFADLISKLFPDPENMNVDSFVYSIGILIDNFINALDSDVMNDKIEQLGSSFASKLAASIQSALDSDPTLMITPVLNTEGMKEQLRTTLGGNINLEGMSASVSAATTTPSAPGIDYQEIRNIVGEVVSEVRILGDKSLTGNDLTRAFEGMAVTIDRSKLVGAIVDAVDVELGKRYGLVLRHNAVPK